MSSATPSIATIMTSDMLDLPLPPELFTPAGGGVIVCDTFFDDGVDVAVVGDDVDDAEGVVDVDNGGSVCVNAVPPVFVVAVAVHAALEHRHGPVV